MGRVASAYLARIIDPEEAFRARARRDRAKLLRLSRALTTPRARRQVAASVAAMEKIAHGLAGASGVFGFAALGDDAARLERLLERWRVQSPLAVSRQRLAAFRRSLDSVLEKLSAVNAP